MLPVKLGDPLLVLVTFTGSLVMVMVMGGGGGLGACLLLPGWLKGACVPVSFLPGWLEGGAVCPPPFFLGGWRGAWTPTSFWLDVWKMGGPFLFLDARMTMGRGEGRGRCEGGRGCLPFPCVPGGGRDRPRPQSCVREFRAQFAQVVFVHLGVGLRENVFAPFCSNRSCCCRDRGCRMCRGCRGCRVGGLSTRAPLLSAGLLDQLAPSSLTLSGYRHCHYHW